jgi:hypothetical protein
MPGQYGDVIGSLALISTAMLAWVTWRSQGKVAQQDFTLKSMGMLNTACMERVEALERRNAELDVRIDQLEAELRLKNAELAHVRYQAGGGGSP